MKRILLLSGFLLLAMAVSQPVQAQFLKKLGKEVSRRVENKVIKEVGDTAVEGVDRAKDETGNAVKGDGKKGEKKSEKGEKKQSKQGEAAAVEETVATESADGLKTPERKGLGEIEKNYDFIPGERTIFETNFSDAIVGNFPRNLEFRGGELSVVSYADGRAIAANSTGAFVFKLPEKLPERFTIEFNLFNSESSGNKTRVEIVDDASFKPLGQQFIRLEGYERRTGVGAYSPNAATSLQATTIINEEMTPIRVMVDGTYVKMYVGKKRVANMPNADLGRSNTILFNFHDVNNKPIYVTDIRIAAGGRSLYQALEATGRVAIHDIHFATGKADILPESSETIGGVAKLLQEHADLKLLIEGHTDNTGDFQKNMQLSTDRAAAVKTYLVEKFNIDEGRLETMGLGQSKPTDTNDTDEGRAKNRRVEIVKL